MRVTLELAEASSDLLKADQARNNKSWNWENEIESAIRNLKTAKKIVTRESTFTKRTNEEIERIIESLSTDRPKNHGRFNELRGEIIDIAKSLGQEAGK